MRLRKLAKRISQDYQRAPSPPPVVRPLIQQWGIEQCSIPHLRNRCDETGVKILVGSDLGAEWPEGELRHFHDLQADRDADDGAAPHHAEGEVT